MTFNYVANYLKNNQAAKTPTMTGYFKREDYELTAEEKAAGTQAKYDLTFVENNPSVDGDGASQYAFTVTVDSDGERTVTAPSDHPLVVDTQLFLMLCSSDWTVMDLGDAQEALNNKNTNRW